MFYREKNELFSNKIYIYYFAETIPAPVSVLIIFFKILYNFVLTNLLNKGLPRHISCIDASDFRKCLFLTKI